jgi:hypothetical protein
VASLLPHSHISTNKRLYHMLHSRWPTLAPLPQATPALSSHHDPPSERQQHATPQQHRMHLPPLQGSHHSPQAPHPSSPHICPRAQAWCCSGQGSIPQLAGASPAAPSGAPGPGAAGAAAAAAHRGGPPACCCGRCVEQQHSQLLHLRLNAQMLLLRRHVCTSGSSMHQT